MLYFDHQLTTQPKVGVVEKMAPYFQIKWLSPVAPYAKDLAAPIEEAYQQIKRLLGQEGHLIFTSSGAEAVNHAIMATYIDVTRKTGKNHFLSTSLSEAPSILAMTRLQEMGCHFDMVRVDEQGQLTKEALIESLTPRTAMLSVSLACGITGALQKLEGIAEICRERQVALHVDVTHFLGKGECTVDADFITFNGEQLGAPKGTGGLLIRGEASPFILGGNEQEGMRGGSLNVPALIGLGEAAAQAYDNRDHFALETARKRALFEERVIALTRARVVLQDEIRLPNVSCCLFPGVKTDALAYCLAQEGFFASMGGGNFQQIAFLLKALKIAEPHSGLSFSFVPEMSQEELLRATKLLFETVAKLQRYSEKI